jgi:hypothetical protein
MDATLETLSARLDRLEREARRWKVLAGGAVGLLALGALLGTAAPGGPEVRASRFVLVDDAGRRRAVLDTDPDAALRIYSKEGQEKIALGLRGGGPGLVLRGGRSPGGATFEVLPDGTPIVNLMRPDSAARAQLALSPRGEPSLLLRGTRVRGGTELAVDAAGSSRLTMRNRSNDDQLVLESPVDGSPALGLRGAGGRLRAVLGLVADEIPALDLRDAAGLPRATLEVRLDGSPRLTLYDTRGTDRADLALDRGGAPRLAFTDEAGAERLAIGPGGAAAAGDPAAAPPGPAVSLFDREGKLVWTAP